ncbi:MAG: GTP cyclohydrolase [Flavobacteriaceae bacterium]|nr:GTP cyclohydrolase [Flavobacteriaceae bacterium]
MSIVIQEVVSKKELKRFIQFPMELYKNNSFYVPPLIKEEMEALDNAKNPVFNHAIAKYYLAYKGKQIVGRIAAIINWKEVNDQNKKKVRFGWFDVIDDIEVTRALLEKVKNLGVENNLEYMEGPVGFSNLDKAGLLTKGFDEIPTMVTLYNAPYYESHLLQLGFEEASEWVEYKLVVPDELPEKVIRFAELIKERYHLHIKSFPNKDELRKVVDPMFKLLDKTYGHLSSYVPIPQQQIEHYKNKYINFINPDFVSCIEDQQGKMIAFAITMPSYSKALQKANGKLFPTGWWHLLQASKKNDAAAFYLIGIDPAFQGKGVTAIVFKEMFQTFNKYGVKYLETNPELAENKSIQTLWKDYNPENHKRRKSFKKEL